MAKKLYVEVGGKTRKAKKGYVSVDGKARKIKKAYVGVDGKARAFWSGGELRYYGTATALSTWMRAIGVSTSHHALFASKPYTTVNAYDASLTRTKPNDLDYNSGIYADVRLGAPAGEYAVFTSCCNTNISSVNLAASAYDSSLTRLKITGPKYANFFCAVSASIQSAAIFSGGCDYQNSMSVDPSRSDSYAVTSGLTFTRISNVETGKYPTACSFGTNALYAGGETHTRGSIFPYSPVRSASAEVFYYNSSLTVGAAPALAAGKVDTASATNGKYALFAGGSTYKTSGKNSTEIASNTVDAYDTSLTRTNPTALSAAGTFYGASLGNYALFASKSNDVNVYDQSLTRTTLHKLSVERTGIASATIGNYALFAGGTISSDTYSNAVDVYTID